MLGKSFNVAMLSKRKELLSKFVARNTITGEFITRFGSTDLEARLLHEGDDDKTDKGAGTGVVVGCEDWF